MLLKFSHSTIRAANVDFPTPPLSLVITIVCDGASAHKIGCAVLPSNMRLVSLPPYCPQLNPQENIWDDMREKFFYNVVFNSLTAVEDRLVDACNHYENNPETVKSISGWNWIVSC